MASSLLLLLLAAAPLQSNDAPLDPVAPSVAPPSVAPPSVATADFAREVRPVLARRCFACHGNDEATREADLRLDLEAEAHALRDGFAAIVPGSPGDSEAWLRITDEFDPMPPEHAGAPLDAEERDLIRRWIESGAEYAQHWAFVPPTRPVVPATTPAEAHPIDAFVRGALQSRGLDLSAQADDYTLLRRVSLDLTGLPPEPETARAYAASRAPGKYDAMVDQLLASPAYAERWAAVWLDLARYADSSGHGSDPLRTIWRYRDWVIEAFDRNLPFDEFTVQQLAGDLLQDATTETRLATAFHRNTMTNTEGGTDDEEFRVLAVKDRVNTTMQVWMGLTAGCAECHSHKFDPISHVEYYQLFDFFNQSADTDRNDDRPRLETPTQEQAGEVARLDTEIAAQDARIAAYEPDLAAGAAALRKELKAWQPVMTFVGPNSMENVPDGWVELEPGGGGTRIDEADLYTDSAIGGSSGDQTLCLKLVARARDGLPGGGPGQSPGNGNFVLTDLQVERVRRSGPLHFAARRVRVELPGAARILSLAEVEVTAAGVNVALGADARQSSTTHDGEAARAVDGLTDGSYELGSVTHTATEDDPWWEVDLGADVLIDGVMVWNRTDGALEERLAGMRLVFLDAAGAEVHRTDPWPAPVPALSATFGLRPSAPLRVSPVAASFEQDGFELARALDSDPTTGWGIGPEQGKRHEATFELKGLTNALEPGDGLRVRLSQMYGGNHTLASYRWLVRWSEAPPVALPDAVHRALERPDEQWGEDERDALGEFLGKNDPAVAEFRKQRRALGDERKALRVATTPVMEELPPDARRATHVLVRGNFLQPGEQVAAAVPAAFPALDSGGASDRLALARWLVSDANPLTARVAVNRVWARLFGRGIVATEGDFGSQGATPTHPALLDWLAVEFRDGGWDHKALLRTLVTSRSYRQASVVTPASRERDPDAVWLSRYPRQRLEAEAVRDVALSASGLLSTKRFGPSVFPPQPDGLWKAAFNGQRNWATSTGEDRYRRGLYVFLRRTIPYPMLATFDAPSRETCTVQRIPTNTPLQAFVTLNDPVFIEASQALAERTLASFDDSIAQEAAIAGRMLWRGLVRPPSDVEIAILRSLMSAALAEFRADPAAAQAFAYADASDPAAAAAWTLAASTVLNLDGVLTKE